MNQLEQVVRQMDHRRGGDRHLDRHHQREGRHQDRSQTETREERQTGREECDERDDKDVHGEAAPAPAGLTRKIEDALSVVDNESGQ